MPTLLSPFDWQPTTRLVFGIGAIERLDELVRQAGPGPVLVVTDPGIAAAGHVEHALTVLARSGEKVAVYDSVRENPTTRDVDACVEAAREAGVRLLVALGGGSSMDTAKGCNFLLTNGGRMQDYRGYGKATRPMLPLVAVPTTAGTGSECQSYALIADEETHQKMACGDPGAAPRVALLDPVLTVSQPAAVTACTGIDAVAHAVESAVTRRATPLSRLYSFEAFALLEAHLERVLADPEDLPARAAMQLGAAFAGTAIELSMLGAAHSAANPLTAHFGTVHGQAVGTMLPLVVDYNSGCESAAAVYRDLAVRAGLVGAGAGVREGAAALAARLRVLLAGAGFPRRLSELGVGEGVLPALAREAAGQWTAGFNPREIGEADFLALYRAAL